MWTDSNATSVGEVGRNWSCPFLLGAPVIQGLLAALAHKATGGATQLVVEFEVLHQVRPVSSAEGTRTN